MIEETNKYHHDCTIIADKGFASKDDFTILDELNLKYVIPLRRGNLFSKTHVPTSITGYDNVFAYNKRAIQSKMVDYDGFNIHIFMDASLMADELADIAIRTEKTNSTTEYKKEKEIERRTNGKGKLTDNEFNSLKPLTMDKIFENKAEIGTITIKTNRKELNSCQIYNIYKQRQKIEQFFWLFTDFFGLRERTGI